MLGVALKVSASDESTGLPPVKLTPQAVGLLALLGLSGAAVILTLSKQKRWHCLFESTQTTSGSLATVASDFFSSHSTPTASSVDDRSTTDVGAHDLSDSIVEELTSEETSCGIGDLRARTGISFAVTADDPSCDKRAPEMLTCAGEVAAVLPAQPHAPSPTEAGRKTRHILKKVQFAPDVVEPSGDGREYRGRIRTARYKYHYV